MWKGSIGLVNSYGGQNRSFASFSGKKMIFMFARINHWLSGCGPYQRGRVSSEINGEAFSDQGARFI
jgi:hypothetical protein